jgi:lipopolysaccharide export system permease protein
MYRILQRYTTKNIFRSLVVVWLVLSSVVVTVLLGDEMDDLWEANASFKQTMLYFACILPQKTFVVLPAICLMGSLFGMLALARHQEMAAMFAAGASLSWLLFPTMVLSLFLGVACFYWHEYVAAPLSRFGEQMLMTEIKKKKGVFRDYGLIRGTNNRFLQYRDFDRESNVLSNIILREMWPGGAGHKLFLKADRAVWDPGAVQPSTGKQGAWRLVRTSTDSENYKILMADNGWTHETLPIEENEVLDIEETPDDFGVFERQAIEMSVREIKARIRALEQDGASADSWYADLEFKRAVPFSVVALILIGLASGASPYLLGREGAARFTYPLGICLIILGCFYAITITCLALGVSGALSPLVSAWLPNVLFGGTGLFLLFRNGI